MTKKSLKKIENPKLRGDFFLGHFVIFRAPKALNGLNSIIDESSSLSPQR